jgi:sporulation protein YpjB
LNRFIVIWIIWLAGMTALPAVSVAQNSDDETSNEQKLQQINLLAVDIYESAKAEDYNTARQKLDDLSRLVTDIRYKEITSVEGMEAFIAVINHARRLFNDIHINVQEALISSARIRFASDALLHTNQPLWLNYYSILKEDVKHLSDAKNREDIKDAQKHIEALSIHYSIVRPAVLITRNPEIVEKMDSILTFIKKQAVNELTFKNNLGSGIEQLRFTVDEVFLKEKSTLGPIPGARSRISITIGIAAVIITVLAFVAWKKFQGSQKPIY